jgi:hypothetical protein
MSQLFPPRKHLEISGRQDFASSLQLVTLVNSQNVSEVRAANLY